MLLCTHTLVLYSAWFVITLFAATNCVFAVVCVHVFVVHPVFSCLPSLPVSLFKQTFACVHVFSHSPPLNSCGWHRTNPLKACSYLKPYCGHLKAQTEPIPLEVYSLSRPYNTPLKNKVLWSHLFFYKSTHGGDYSKWIKQPFNQGKA